MSSTSRGSVREPSDYYVTPRWAIEQVLDALLADRVWPSRPVCVFDPCAGGDDKREMAYPTVIKARPELEVAHIYTMDIREDSRADTKQDYLDAAIVYQPDVIITNPPFALALEIIQKALADSKPGGLVVMLQRLNLFGSRARSAWFIEHMPAWTYVHSRRMKFHEDGAINPNTGKRLSGDSIEYAHFVWIAGRYPKFSNLRVLPYV